VGEPGVTAVAEQAPRRLLRNVIGVLATAAVLIGVALALRGQDWRQVVGLITVDRLPVVLAAVGVNAAGLLIGMAAWRCTLHGLGGRIGWAPAAQIYFSGLAAKFIPGRLWVVLAQIRLAGRSGVPASATVAAFLLNLAVVTLTGLLAGAVAATALPERYRWLLVVPALAGAIVLIRPRLITQLAVAGARLVRRPLQDVDPQRTGLRTAIAVQFACWGVAGLHLWLLAMLLGAEPVAALGVCVGGFALAMVTGTLAVFTPDGLGVREGVLALALATILPLPAVGVAVLASRAVCLISELLTIALVLAATWRPERTGVFATVRRGNRSAEVDQR
jgi:hypothetical protein